MNPNPFSKGLLLSHTAATCDVTLKHARFAKTLGSVKNNSKPLDFLLRDRDSFCDFAEFDFLP